MRRMSRKTALVALVVVFVLTGVTAWWFKGGQPVTVVQVVEGTLEEQVRGSARVRARVAVTLSARVTAAVIAMEADKGDSVRRDQVLVRLDDRDLKARRASAYATLARVQADLALAESKEQRDKEIFQKGYISAAAMDASTLLHRAKTAEATAVSQEIKLADTQASYANLRSPMAGVVVARLAEPGDMVSPGTPLLRLIDPTTLQVVARIDETEAGRIQAGMPVLIRLRTGSEVTGKVSRIALEADAAARELEVDIAFDKPLTRFAIDQEAEVAIHVGTAQGLVIPVSSLIRQEGKVGVLRVREGRAQFQSVEAGTSGQGMILIRKGLNAGELLVRDAQLTRAGARVRPSLPSE